MSAESVATTKDTVNPYGSGVITDDNADRTAPPLPAPFDPNQAGSSSNSDYSGDDLIEIDGVQGVVTLPPSSNFDPNDPDNADPYATVNYANDAVTAGELPTIGMEWTSLPDAVPEIFSDNPANQASTSGTPTSPGIVQISVPFPAVLGVEQTILTLLESFTTQYGQLVSDTMTATSNPGFFGQQALAAVYYAQAAGTPQEMYWNTYGWSYDPLAAEYADNIDQPDGTYIVPDVRIQNLAEQFVHGPDNPNSTDPTYTGASEDNGIEAAMQSALVGMAGTAAALGQYVALIRKSLDAYAYADTQSAVPTHATLQLEQLEQPKQQG